MTKMADEFIDSPMLGRSRILTAEEEADLARRAQDSPVAAFQALNRCFNEKGLCLSIGKLGL